MDILPLEGSLYRAVFLDYTLMGEKDFEYTCWRTSPSAWWEGKTIIEERESGGQVRATFETFHRADVQGGVRNESLEESLLLVSGRRANGSFVSYKGGAEIVTDRVGVIDYLLGGMYNQASERAKTEFVPHLEIPLLEQHDLAERGYAKPEQLVGVGIPG